MTIDDIVAKLNGAKKTRQGWIARCPAHDDATASLSVSSGSKQSIVLHCHAGCDLSDVLEAAGLSRSDLRQNGQHRRVVVKRYVYHDANGDPVLRVCRTEPKGFYQQHLSGGRWINGRGKIALIPYCLPSVIGASDVYIVEGEKDADALSRLGVVATCNPGGAGKWPRDWSRYLERKHVVIIPDNDAPGRNHALDVASKLLGSAASIKIIDLPGVADHGDVSDWIDAGGTRHELESLASSTVEHVESTSWDTGIVWVDTSRGRSVSATEGNASIILAHHEAWSGCIGYDDFAGRCRWRRAAPSVSGMIPPSGDVRDDHAIFVQQWLHVHYGVKWSRSVISSAIESSARANPYHPVRDYLSSLSWDGQPRADAWLTTYLGAEDCELARSIGRWWLISAVARVYSPGCQADHMLILEGRQGVGKSSAIKILAGEWYLGELPDLRDKDAYQVLQGAWIVEIGELDALRGQAATRIKSFVSQRLDRYRPSYGRYTVDRPRQCIFSGSTNDQHYLHDATGARRFWPVAVSETHLDRLEEDRDQIWAEATVRYHDGATWWPSTVEESDALSSAQDDRYDADPWEDAIASLLRTRIGQRVSLSDLLVQVVGSDQRDWTRSAQMRISSICRRLGWSQGRRRTNGGDRQRYYWAPDDVLF